MMKTPGIHIASMNHPLRARLTARVGAALASDAYATVLGKDVREALQCSVPETSEAWSNFLSMWDYLPQDEHMADGGKYRFRRFSILRTRITCAGSTFTVLPHRAFYQSEGYNGLNGGVARQFEPVSGESLRNPVMKALLALCAEILQAVTDVHDWETELHPIRTRAIGGAFGLATPEGSHQDGVDYFFVVMAARKNLRGAVSHVYDEDRREIFGHCLTEPFEILAVHDPRTFHSVTPFVAEPSGHPEAYRDVIVINFRDRSLPDLRL